MAAKARRDYRETAGSASVKSAHLPWLNAAAVAQLQSLLIGMNTPKPPAVPYLSEGGHDGGNGAESVRVGVDGRAGRGGSRLFTFTWRPRGAAKGHVTTRQM